MKRRLKIAAFCFAAVFSACSPAQKSTTVQRPDLSDSSSKSNAVGTYTAPPFAENSFNKDAAIGENGVLIDFSSAEYGYIGVSAQNDKKLKLRLIKDDVTYTYNLKADGTELFFSLTMGDGEYQVKVMQNTTDISYIPIYTQTYNVKLLSEFEPFLRPNIYCDYSAASASVKKAAELISSADTDAEAAALIYAYIKDNILYDKQKANEATTIYVPSPDETFTSNKGICFDYASLAAAMLRSQGIPAKIIRGVVAPNDINHAWNMIWLKEKGWIEVNIQLPAESWERIDLTFAAGGADKQYIGDGSNYTDMFVH